MEPLMCMMFIKSKPMPRALMVRADQKIKKPLATVAANDLVGDRTWYLIVPLDPTLEGRQDWLADLGITVPFDCEWFGLTNLDGLAAKHPK